jgi:hypothetical protein
VSDDEKRGAQRLNLVQPLDGWFGDFPIRMIDVSATGALIEYDEAIPSDARGLLRFFWRGEEIELLAETARALDNRAGLRFLDDDLRLRQFIAASATELLIAQEANAAGQRDDNVVGDGTLTARAQSSTFVSWLLADGKWSARASLLPDQPNDGFTVSAAESDDQVALLRRTYESGDTESRRLTRLLAELSVDA